ncbi:MAG: hemerythrin family protein [Bryobacteraceae bacterium]
MDQAIAIQELTDSGAVTAALKTEHQAIEDALQSLDNAISAGAIPPVLTGIIDVVVDFCTSHFDKEELAFRDSGYAGTDAHERAHQLLLGRIRAARLAIGEGQPGAALGARDLLNHIHEHIADFDRPAYVQLLWKHIESGGQTFNRMFELCRSEEGALQPTI